MAAKFEAGQVVKWARHRDPATIISGPHETYGADRWLIRKADGKVTLTRESELSAIKDRRTLVAEALYESLGIKSRADGFNSLGISARGMYLRTADKVLAALDEVEPQAKARIRILRDGLGWADVKRGDVLTVREFNAGARGAELWVETDKHPRGYWTFGMSGEGTGWERV